MRGEIFPNTANDVAEREGFEPSVFPFISIA